MNNSHSINEFMEVTFHEDDSFTIEWDMDHPVGKVFNNWTEDDFIEAIMNYVKKYTD